MLSYAREILQRYEKIDTYLAVKRGKKKKKKPSQKDEGVVNRLYGGEK